MTLPVSIQIGGQEIRDWDSYDVELDLLQPADAWSVSMGGPSREIVRLCKPDAAVKVYIDNTPILTGFIDDRDVSVAAGGGSSLDVSGRDRMGRLVDESCELLTYRGLTLEAFAKKVAAPWFTDVVLSNAQNRLLLRGSGPKSRAFAEPIISKTAKASKKVEPGESRWEVLSSFLEEAGLLCWSTGDGKLFIGQANYDQEPQYDFRIPLAGSDDAESCNVKDARHTKSVGERYSKIIAMGAGRGDSSNYGARVMKRRAEVRDGDFSDGTGRDFTYPKTLYVADDDLRNIEQARERATREMAERDSGGLTLQLSVEGHRQPGGPLFAPDTVASVSFPLVDESQPWYVTKVNFRCDRGSGQTTQLSLVPLGTELRL